MVMAVFRESDVHGTGRIQQEELAEIIKAILPDVSIATLNEIFAVSDVDGEGCLSYEEFVSFIFGMGSDMASGNGEPATVPELSSGDTAGDAMLAAELEASQIGDGPPRHESSVLSRAKEPSCPGTLLVAAGGPLGECITMLGGMLAHPCVGCYPYREGPAPTIVAAQLSAGNGGCVPAAMRRALAKVGAVEAFDLFFIVSDVSKGGFARASAFNIVHHPWCFPKVNPGQTIGTGSGWVVGLHVPAGGGLSSEPVSRVRPGARQKDADPTGATLDALERTSVFVHPGFGGALCCSPNNVRVGMRRPSPVPVATLWAACARGAGTTKPLRSCVSVHWLVADAVVARNLAAVATEACTLREFLHAAAAELGPETAPVVAATVACGV